jgi:hypothetical protein
MASTPLCLGQEPLHKPPTSTEVKIMQSYTSTSHISSWHGVLLVKDGENYTLSTSSLRTIPQMFSFISLV